MPSFDELIVQRLREAELSGELRACAQWGKPLDLDEGDAQTPEELRMAYKALEDAGMVPPEVETMQQIAALARSIEADPAAPDVQARRQRLSELRQHLALRLEKLSSSRSL